jgi:hypothetical protein
LPAWPFEEVPCPPWDTGDLINKKTMGIIAGREYEEKCPKSTEAGGLLRTSTRPTLNLLHLLLLLLHLLLLLLLLLILLLLLLLLVLLLLLLLLLASV